MLLYYLLCFISYVLYIRTYSFASLLHIHIHAQTFLRSFSFRHYVSSWLDSQSGDMYRRVGSAVSTYITRLTSRRYVQATWYAQRHYILVDKGAMAVREIRLSERGSTYISASERRQSASFPRDSDSGRPCQALVHTHRLCTMLRRFPGVIIRGITARAARRRGLSIRIFPRAVASLSGRSLSIAIPNEVQLRWKGHEPIWEIRL